MIYRIESVCQTLLDRWHVATLHDYALLIAAIVVIGWLIARASERRAGIY
jgi:hypothetical protein